MKTVDRCKTFKPTNSVLHYIDSMLAFFEGLGEISFTIPYSMDIQNVVKISVGFVRCHRGTTGWTVLIRLFVS